MEKSRKTEEEFNIGELSGEAIREWYAEREIIESERRMPERDETIVPPTSEVFRAPKIEEKISEEEDKRALIKDKIKELLDLGEKKGLNHAIEKARQSDDPFLLDIFHDILAKDENYKKILKK